MGVGIIGSSRLRVSQGGDFPIDGLFSYYKFEETSGDAIDSFSNNNGTILGNVTQGVEGKISKGYEFGSGSGISLGSLNLNIENAYSFSLWFKRSGGGIGMLISNDNSFQAQRFYQLRLNSNGAVEFIRFNSGGGVSTFFGTAESYDDGIFHLVNSTFSIENGSRIYVDGVLKAINGDKQPNKSGFGGSHTIGARSSNGTLNSFIGILDEVAIFENKELNQEDINKIYNQGNGKTI